MKNNKFDINSFISPDVSNAPVYIWVWNDVCSCEIIDTQLEEIQNLGIRSFYILPEPREFRPESMPTNLTPEYLTDEYFELCAYAVEKATDLGMRCWIYDEGGWPSGSACGRVIKDHPEYARQTLEVYECRFSAGDVYKKTRSDVVATFVGDSDMISEEYDFVEDAVVTEYFIKKEDGRYPDLLNKKATDYFIEITHEKYAAAMKSQLGKNVTAVFTDEPKAPTDAFNDKLVEQYEAKYGESILPYLPLIMDRVKVTDENVHILHRWYDLCSKMFCDNFLLPCKKWANKNGLAFTGHMDMDHKPVGCVRGGNNFNLMRALRCLDIPGVDVIWRQLFPEDRITERNDHDGYNGFFPRYASSAAAQNGTDLAMSEILGVAGTAVTYDIMRYTVGYQAVRGINIFNPFNFPLGRKGALLAQELPIFTESQPYYKYLKQFNGYVERLSYLSSLGDRVCETGLYYPVCDFQGRLNADTVAEAYDTLGRSLEDLVVDFDIVDDDVIQGSVGTDNGYIRMGKASYRQIIIPQGAFVPQETQAVLDRFVKGGGRVSYSLSDLTPVIDIEGKGLRAMHRKTENGDLFFLFRECGESGDYRVHLPEQNGYLLNMENGKLQHFKADDGILNISLAIGETVVVLLTDEVFDAENKKVFKEKFTISDELMFRKERELICDENGFEIINHFEKVVSVNVGDWSELVGNAYSGSGVYETTFTIPAERVGKEGEIDLGDVHYAAEVFLNGYSLGAVLMPPYRLSIPAGVLDENNTLKIVVTNTSANWYEHTDYFEKWDIRELSPYFEPELKYGKDFVSGGLYGPVTLCTE